MAKKRKKRKVRPVLIVLCVILLILVVVSSYYFYRSKKLEVKLPDDTIVVEYGKEFDPKSLGFDSKYQLTFSKTVNTATLGEQKVKFEISDGIFKKAYEVTVIVADLTPPEFKLYYKTIATSSVDPGFRSNVVDNRATDNYDKAVSVEIGIMDGEKFVEITDFSEYKAGIYEIVYRCIDSSGNENRQITTYLYKMTPNNMKTPFKFDGKTILVNKLVPLPKGYAPGVNKEAKSQLDKMFAAIKKAGAGSISIRSGYRSYSTQTRIFAGYAARDGEMEANRYSAKAGHSEHQSGLAFDIGKIDESFDKTLAFDWLTTNAHKYGFIMRYPKGKEKITGYIYEPWHWRYVGVEMATEVYEAGVTLEEFIGFKYR